MENVDISTVVEDFDIGDRFYATYFFRVALGTVDTKDSEGLGVLFDDEKYIRFTHEELGNPGGRESTVGKPLDLMMVQEGSTISRLEGDLRIYAEVLTFIPSSEISYRFIGKKVIHVIEENNRSGTIEQQMIDWQVEG